MTPEAAVAEIIEEVRHRGDEALIDFTHQFDGVELSRLEVTREEIAQAYRQVDTDLLDALHLAADRVRAFHSRLAPQGWLDLAKGLGQMVRPLDRVGLYIPGGGAAYPSTVLMTAIPARVAGVREVIVTTPARGRGEVPPATLVACDLAQVDRVFRVGGPHAIAALAYGTATVPAVDKVCGPGNLLVQLAKKAVFGVVGVDTIQGPSETIVVADDRTDPALCAADLLAQAEHGEDARPVLLTTSPRLAERVARRLQTDVRALPEGSPAPRSLERHGLIAEETND
jgi:histidinol dehydrogenase